MSQATAESYPGTVTYSASSFLMNELVTSSNTAGRTSATLAQFDAPSQFILLGEGVRTALSAGATGNYEDTPDFNGNKISIWNMPYLFHRGSTQHMFNQYGSSNFKDAPFHKNGIVLAFLDGHVKYVTSDMGNPAPSLESKMPWCQYGNIPQADPNCTTQWNNSDSGLN
jgi:prepilin-type processing-associated H-X9-DG protein